MSDGITFQVETNRILEILANDIYDSPLALLRENLQNAYDAVRMRFAADGILREGGEIEINISGKQLAISDNGVGMTEPVLRENFWKAGSSGKRTVEAKQAGVVGTFGIGAMANFGVCSELKVITKSLTGAETLVSSARKDSLRIAEECISLDIFVIDVEAGTTVVATMDDDKLISEAQAKTYLAQYVGNLPVPVRLNGSLISQRPIDELLSVSNRNFSSIGNTTREDEIFSAKFDVHADQNGQVLVRVESIKMLGNVVEGQMALLQSGGQLLGLRSHFGLAPIPVVGSYSFGGFADLSFLNPTAGREALSRESISCVDRIVRLAELAASEAIAGSSHADKNNDFLTWICANGRYDLAENVTIQVMPSGEDVKLGAIGARVSGKAVHYYQGTDKTIVNTFASEESPLLQVASTNPRRKLQSYYVKNILKVAEVPSSAQILKRYEGKDLVAKEASVLIRVGSIVRDDYLLPDVEVVFADISHGVSILVNKVAGKLTINIAKNGAFLQPLFEFYEKAYDLFTQFMKDFVRVQIYPRIQPYVPSSTRDGVDALRKLLQRNKELYRYDQEELGNLEGVLGEYLSGNATFSEVLRQSRTRVRAQAQTVLREQVGTIEDVAGLAESPVAVDSDASNVFDAMPPIMRDQSSSDKKILITEKRYPALNNFKMLLGLSDRLMRAESDFFRTPHTTRIIWGGHRVVYIFTESSGRLSLYYDIELRTPIDQAKASGGMFPTTTLIMKDRIFVPVPDELLEEFRIAAGAKEFFVRFDVLSGSEPAADYAP